VKTQVAGEQPEQGNRQIPDDGLFDLAEPSHETGEDASRDSIRDDEIDALLMERAFNERG
jgi:hypothetical protein